MGKKTLKCCYGISSFVSPVEHVFFIDYDNVRFKQVVDHINYMQKEFSLGDFYVIQSSNGFNAVCLDMLPSSLIYHIGINIFSPADKNYFKYGFERGYYTLRFDSDKHLVATISNNNKKYRKSLAHKKFLEFFFDIVIPDGNFDTNMKLSIIQFPSGKNGYHIQDKIIPDYFERLTGVIND